MAIHKILPNNLSNRIYMHIDIHGNDIREAGSIFQLCTKKNTFFVIGWQTLEWCRRFCELLKEITELTKVQHNMYPSIYTILLL